jgi:hypothetical protein
MIDEVWILPFCWRGHKSPSFIDFTSLRELNFLESLFGLYTCLLIIGSSQFLNLRSIMYVLLDAEFRNFLQVNDPAKIFMQQCICVSWSHLQDLMVKWGLCLMESKIFLYLTAQPWKIEGQYVCVCDVCTCTHANTRSTTFYQENWQKFKEFLKVSVCLLGFALVEAVLETITGVHTF